jgi:hypothetical protein
MSIYNFSDEAMSEPTHENLPLFLTKTFEIISDE